MADSEKRGHLYLLTGLILGALIGILIGWVISPVKYVDISPAALHESYKEQYLVIVAKAYQTNEDMGRAYARIKLMSNPVSMTELRLLQQKIENNPDFSQGVHEVRDFLNDLDQYIQTGGNKAEEAVVGVSQAAVIPTGENMISDQNSQNVPDAAVVPTDANPYLQDLQGNSAGN